MSDCKKKALWVRCDGWEVSGPWCLSSRPRSINYCCKYGNVVSVEQALCSDRGDCPSLPRSRGESNTNTFSICMYSNRTESSGSCFWPADSLFSCGTIPKFAFPVVFPTLYDAIAVAL